MVLGCWLMDKFSINYQLSTINRILRWSVKCRKAAVKWVNRLFNKNTALC